MEQISFLYSQLLDSLEKKKKETCGMMERVQRSETWIVFQHYENKGKLQPGNGHEASNDEPLIKWRTKVLERVWTWETTRNHQILDPICCYITFYSNTLGKREIVRNPVRSFLLHYIPFFLHHMLKTSDPWFTYADRLLFFIIPFANTFGLMERWWKEIRVDPGFTSCYNRFQSWSRPLPSDGLRIVR